MGLGGGFYPLIIQDRKGSTNHKRKETHEMNQKPLGKHRGRPSSQPVNAVMKALLQESHFTLKEFAKFAGVSPGTIDNYLYMRISPVCRSKDCFWRPSAKKLAIAFGMNPEELYPASTWEHEIFDSMSPQNLAWRIERWRKTNTMHLVSKHERSHMLFSMLMSLPKAYRTALMHWALKEPQTSSRGAYLVKKGLKRLQRRMSKLSK